MWMMKELLEDILRERRDTYYISENATVSAHPPSQWQSHYTQSSHCAEHTTLPSVGLHSKCGYGCRWQRYMTWWSLTYLPDIPSRNEENLTIYKLKWPPLWSSGQSSWLQILRSQVRFPALPDFLRSSGSGAGSTQPREDNWGATWMEK
jgi:hypothetical protein